MAEKKRKGTEEKHTENQKKGEQNRSWIWIGFSVILLAGVILTGVMLNVADIRDTRESDERIFFFAFQRIL